jgi:hypothetical protein
LNFYINFKHKLRTENVNSQLHTNITIWKQDEQVKQLPQTLLPNATVSPSNDNVDEDDDK